MWYLVLKVCEPPLQDEQHFPRITPYLFPLSVCDQDGGKALEEAIAQNSCLTECDVRLTDIDEESASIINQVVGANKSASLTRRVVRANGSASVIDQVVVADERLEQEQGDEEQAQDDEGESQDGEGQPQDDEVQPEEDEGQEEDDEGQEEDDKGQEQDDKEEEQDDKVQ